MKFQIVILFFVGIFVGQSFAQGNPFSLVVTLPEYREPEMFYPYAYQKLSPVSMSYDMGMDRSLGYARWYQSPALL
jgi:hypothetical protein